MNGFVGPGSRTDRNRRWSSGHTMRDNGREPMCSSPVAPGPRLRKLVSGRGTSMAAMKPRTGDGPLEVTKEGRSIIMRVPLEGGGRLVVELTPDEADALGDALKAIAG